MSVVEVLSELRKLRGKFERVEGIKAYPTFTEHIVKRFDVNETAQEYDLEAIAYFLKLKAEGGPIYVNLGRPITSNEYFDLMPEQVKYIARVTDKIYAKVLQGYGSGRLIVEGLGLA